MKNDSNINYDKKKPKYLTRYERIFNELLKNDSYNNDNITDRFIGHQKNNTFYQNFNANTLLLNSRNLNLASNYNTISNAKYQLITGKELNENRKGNKYEKKSMNNKYERYQPDFLMKNLKKKQNIVRNFKEYIKKTEKIYERNYRDNNNNINKIFPNHNRSRNLSGNIFIEKLYTQFPEYTTLTNRGQTFLSTKTLKENEFRSLKNQLKNI